MAFKLFDSQVNEKRKETSLRRSEAAYREVFESILAGYWDWNLVDNTEYLSPTFKRMFGYEDHEMESSPEAWQTIIFQEDLPGILESFDRHVKSHGREPFRNEVRYHHKDGSTVWVICAGRVVEWTDDGQPVRMVGCHIDISEHMSMERALNESIERYSHLVSRMPVGIYIAWIRASGNMQFEYVSDRWCAIHELDRDAVLEDADAVNDLVHPEEREQFLKENEKAHRLQKPFTWEGRYFTGTGALRYLRIESTPTVFENGDIRWFGVTQDITERVRAASSR